MPGGLIGLMTAGVSMLGRIAAFSDCGNSIVLRGPKRDRTHPVFDYLPTASIEHEVVQLDSEVENYRSLGRMMLGTSLHNLLQYMRLG
jgi:hypothetical protein